MYKPGGTLTFDITNYAVELYRDSGGTYCTVDFSSFDAD